MDLSELRQFRRVWSIDFEFTQGKGSGTRPVLICMSARSLFTPHHYEWDEAQLRQRPCPFDLEHDLFVAYAARAEMSCFAALGWPIPRYILDLYVEFRHHRNDGRQHKYSLLAAMDYCNLPTIDAQEKREMVDLAIRGGPYTPAEIHALQAYCASDTHALTLLLPALAPSIDLRYALVRGRFTGCVGRIEHVGVPIDMRLLAWLHEHWGSLRALFVDRMRRDWDLFDASGQLKRSKFQVFVDSLRIPYWPLTPTGWYRRDTDTLRDMGAIYPGIQKLRESFDFLGQIRQLKLAVGPDGRNRTPLWPLSTKTMRCAPSTTEFIFNLPAWLRFLIQPRKGYALAYIDARQEEPAIAACLSGDLAMTHGYRVGGDLYLDFAQRAGAIPPGLPATDAKTRYEAIRNQYKICLLASMYGQQEQSLSSRMGQPPLAARMLLRQLRTAYPRFTAWIDNEIDWAVAQGFMRSRLGWTLQVHDMTRETSLLNYPMQVTGSEILQRWVYFTQQAGVTVCATVHDAVLIEAPQADMPHHAWLTKEALRRASADILSGFELLADGWEPEDFIVSPNRYRDKRGHAMWDEIRKLWIRRYQEILIIPGYDVAAPPLAPLISLGK